MAFRRIPKEIDPRRPPKRREPREGGESEPRSYGQYIEISPEELAELERATDEVAREGTADIEPVGERRRRASVDEREEFEEVTDEVSREGGHS